MNLLERYIAEQHLRESSVMDLLQLHGIISDDCVMASEVVDDYNAVCWLKARDIPTEIYEI